MKRVEYAYLYRGSSVRTSNDRLVVRSSASFVSIELHHVERKKKHVTERKCLREAIRHERKIDLHDRRHGR